MAAARDGLLLSGRLALVTGGASGIGRAICQSLAKAGASVAVVDRNIEGAEETLNSLSKVDGSKHSYHCTDVTSSDQVKELILKGTFLMSQITSKAMVEHKITNGTIINIASIVGKTGLLGHANYTASKAGVEGLTKTCARELASFGIRCNAVLPGFIKTPMTENAEEKYKQRLMQMIPLGRMGEPSEVANVVNFLASDLSSYITGASIEVTGGLRGT